MNLCVYSSSDNILILYMGLFKSQVQGYLPTAHPWHGWDLVFMGNYFWCMVWLLGSGDRVLWVKHMAAMGSLKH